MTENTIPLEEALELRDGGALFVDARSPSEFEEATIPGAINAPILDDIQRAEIGTLYKEAGNGEALKRGMEIVAPQIPELVETVRRVAGGRETQVVVFCWRGGLRSKALTSFLNLAAIPAVRLEGGHKAFRRYLLEYFENFRNEKIVALCGLSGVGKTRILKRLEDRGHHVVNLEALANNRGSAFGSIGLPYQPGQKMFEALLWDKLRKVGPEQPIFTEMESRRLGKVSLPPNFFEALNQGRLLWLTASLERRTEVILQEYPDPRLHTERFVRQINSLRKRLGNKIVEHLLDLMERGQWRQLVSELLERYYDPLYLHTKPENVVEIKAETEAEALEGIKAAIV